MLPGVGVVLFVGVDAVQRVVPVGAGEGPAEWSGDGVAAGLERGQAVADLLRSVKSLGLMTLRWTIEK